MPFTRAGGHRLEYRRIAGRTPAIVMLHEGLGSLSMWKSFPDDVAGATGHEVVVYSRYGHGNSAPLTADRDIRYMHDEALTVLREFLDALALERPILFGHSDGASIAIIHAGGAGRAVAGLILAAPHVLVEELSITSIARMKEIYATTDLRTRLGRYHQDVDGTFRGWNDIWLREDFARWNIESYLPAIKVPILAVQGRDDEYGTMDQVRRIARQSPDVTVLELEACGHSPHRDQPARVLDAVREFVARIDARQNSR